MAEVSDPSRRHDFILLFDVTSGNPNGDPDAGNAPRVDPETMRGLVTDVALKRKIRNWVDAAKGNDGRYKIYVEAGEALNSKHERAYTACGLKPKKKAPAEEITQVRQWMCENFYDVRMFGAVMSTGVNCGQVRGPAQLTFAQSRDPIMTLEPTITRVAVTRVEDLVSEANAEGKTSEMGKKPMVPYGLYVSYGFFTPQFAAQTGVTDEDLALLWAALQNMWDLDHSASRGLMACRGLHVFTHDSPLGDAPAQALFERMKVERVDAGKPPREWADYQVGFDEEGLPEKVSLRHLVG